MKHKGFLQKFIDKKYGKGNWWLAGNDMVVIFCEKYHISGSAHGYDLYTHVQKAWKKALKEEEKEIENWKSR